MAFAPTPARAQPTLVPPRLLPLEHGHPRYPAEADGRPARALTSVTVDAYGRVVAAEVLEVDREGAAAEPFRAAALDYVRALELEPATRDGSPVPATLRFEVLFEPPAPDAHGHVHDHAHAHPEHAGAADGVHAHPHPHAHAHAGDAPTEAGSVAPRPTRPELSATASAPLGVADEAPRAASDVEVELGLLRALPRRTAEELLTLAPGIVLSNHSGIGHASAYYLRGFDAAEGQDVEVLVDGMPINEPSNAHVHGYADAYFVIPEAVRAVRVLEGPFDPRQGDFAVAGTFEYRLGTAERGVLASAEYGAFDTKRLLLLWAPDRASDGTLVALDLRDGDGFGPNRAHQSVSALARYEAGADTPLRWSLTAGSSALEYDSAGVVREDAVAMRALPCDPGADAQFFCLHDPQQGGSASRHFVLGALALRRPGWTLEQRAFLALRQQRARENFTGALLDARGDGLDELTESTVLGLRGALRLAPTWLGRRQLVEVGYAARHDDGRARMWRLRTEGGDPYEVVFDSELALTQVGVYGAAELRLLERVALRVGLRVESFAYSLVDQDRPTEDRTGPRLPSQAVDAFGVAALPKGTLRVALAPAVDWVTSVGLGARSSDAQALSEGETAPFASVRAAETGLAADGARLGPLVVDARAFGFFSHVTRDLVFDPERGRNVDAGESNRFGLSAFARARLDEALDVTGTFTWTEAQFTDGGFFDLGNGPRVPFVPRFVGTLAAAGRGALALTPRERLVATGGGSLTWVGEKPLPLGAVSAPILSLDLRASLGWRWVEVGAMVLNALDRRNRAAELQYASSFEGSGPEGSMREARHFAAAAPRTWWLTLTVRLDTTGLGGTQ